MTMRKKLLITIACLSVILCTLITGTIAWLIDKTEPVKNTFSPSNVAVALTETTGNQYKMIPGKTYAKDPTVTVTTDIDCYVFVKVNKSTNLDTFITYTMNDGWQELTQGSGIFYREASANATFYVLKGTEQNPKGEVMVKTNITESDMSTLTSESVYPTLTFTAYAIQKEGFADAATAWAEASK